VIPHVVVDRPHAVPYREPMTAGEQEAMLADVLAHASPPRLPDTPHPIAVLVAAGHAGTRLALESLLDGEPDIQRQESTRELFSTIRALRALRPDVVVVDLRAVGGRITGLRPLAAAAPAAALLMVGMEDHPCFAARARAEGATAYIRLEAAADRLVTVVRQSVSARPAPD
jgi:DNA-binding NarL/FixJ family response regulator